MAFAEARLGAPRRVRADRVVVLLLRHGVGSDELREPIGRDLGELLVRRRRLQVRPRLLELLVDLGRLDVGELLSLRDHRSDVRVPGLHVAVGPGVDRRRR